MNDFYLNCQGSAAHRVGQGRAGEQMVDVLAARRPGTTVFLEPLYQGGLDGVTPGSACIANIHSSNYERLAKEKVGFFEGLFLHAVDATAPVHAAILLVQALVLPVKVLVFGGH